MQMYMTNTPLDGAVLTQGVRAPAYHGRTVNANHSYLQHAEGLLRCFPMTVAAGPKPTIAVEPEPVDAAST